MPSRASSLKRIEKLYSLVESMHATALEQAAARMHEAEAAIGEQTDLIRNARADAHRALATGDRERWALAEVQRDHSQQLQQSLETVRKERELATAQARAIYISSRIQRGQIKTVVDQSAAVERIVEDRRAQSAVDDRFLSRLAWNRLSLDLGLDVGRDNGKPA